MTMLAARSSRITPTAISTTPHKRQHRALHLGSRHVPSPISIARERFPRFADHRRR
ncbi:hypothetical protein Ae717Ps2_6783 [Pseudonocardia sp. Ae717_Ps2]|nr:hypothetical protein Ae717Ps2_6783 [Pseudonocardia sp. Ae717_Ps2]